MGDDGFEMPREVATAWGIGEGSRRGRKPRFDLERITAAAIAVADAEGLAAVSMTASPAISGPAPCLSTGMCSPRTSCCSSWPTPPWGTRWSPKCWTETGAAS